MSKHEKDTGKFKAWVNDTTMNAQSLTKRAAIETVCFVLASVAAYLTVIYGKAILIIFFELTSLLSNNGMSNDTSTNSKSFEGARNIAFALTALVGGPFLVWRTILADKQTRTAQMQTAIAQEKASLDEQTHYTTLYTKSIELLGSTRVVKKRDDDGKIYDDTEAALELRLGAIYALERIARDSWKDHWPIMEVLTAYIMENSPHDIYDKGAQIEIIKPDVQAAITVIGRRNPKWIEEESTRQKIKFSNCNFSHANFRDLDGFTDTLFERCHFDRAVFEKTILTNTHFENCILYNVNFISCDMNGVNLQYTTLDDVEFYKCNLELSYIVFKLENSLRFKKCTLKNSMLDQLHGVGKTSYEDIVWFYYCNLSYSYVNIRNLNDILFDDSIICASNIKTIDVQHEVMPNALISDESTKLHKIKIHTDIELNFIANEKLTDSLFDIILSEEYPSEYSTALIKAIVDKHTP